MPTITRGRDTDPGQDDDLDGTIEDPGDGVTEDSDDVATTFDLDGAAPGRVCTEPGCTTVLSRYNATAWCGVHHRRDWRATREPRRRSA